VQECVFLQTEEHHNRYDLSMMQCTSMRMKSIESELSIIFLLQIQRKLQLRIEEQGKYLQMMLEKQCKSSTEKVQDPSSGDATPDQSHSADKDSGAAVDQNRIGDKPGIAEPGKGLALVGVEHKLAEADSDRQTAPNDGSSISQEKAS
jgi:hypothetical protein